MTLRIIYRRPPGDAVPPDAAPRLDKQDKEIQNDGALSPCRTGRLHWLLGLAGYGLLTAILGASLVGSWLASRPPAAPPRAPIVPTTGQETRQDLRAKTLHNPTAYIPPECYTQTVMTDGRVHNPCYSCHHASRPPNFTNDIQLQRRYAFPDDALTNRWLNLYIDRRPAVTTTSDAVMRDYIRQDNYFAEQGQIILQVKLAAPPATWDFNGDGRWQGYIPDSHFDFDAQGFDRDPQGGYTGWRALAYYPFLATHWPTNGAPGDVQIRLAAPLRRDESGQFDLTIYKINLAIVEAMIKREDVAIDPIDEARLRVDLDKDGQLGTADQVTYDWQPLAGRFMSYVGQARLWQTQGRLHLAAGLFPEGTEFLQSLRYIDFDEQGRVRLSRRVKELRHARKLAWRSYSALRAAAADENAEATQFPDRLRTVYGDVETGASNGEGWRYQGFIEAANGALRPQTYEETVYCVGCHSTVGAVSDGNYSFARKFPATGFRRGWYHFSQRDLAGIPEPRRADGQYEYSLYLRQNPSGNALGINPEVRTRFFATTGQPKPAAFARLHRDLTYLIWPSEQRAMALNKAYWQIVKAQSYILGRDATVAPVYSVHCGVWPEQTTGVTMTTTLSGPWSQ